MAGMPPSASAPRRFGTGHAPPGGGFADTTRKRNAPKNPYTAAGQTASRSTAAKNTQRRRIDWTEPDPEHASVRAARALYRNLQPVYRRITGSHDVMGTKLLRTWLSTARDMDVTPLTSVMTINGTNLRFSAAVMAVSDHSTKIKVCMLDTQGEITLVCVELQLTWGYDLSITNVTGKLAEFFPEKTAVRLRNAVEVFSPFSVDPDKVVLERGKLFVWAVLAEAISAKGRHTKAWYEDLKTLGRYCHTKDVKVGNGHLKPEYDRQLKEFGWLKLEPWVDTGANMGELEAPVEAR